MERLDDTIKTPEDVSENLALSTLGNIGRLRGRNPGDRLIAGHHPKSPLSEGYRTLRTNLQFSTVDKSLSSLLVTSPSPGEGKSVTAANLGVVMAQTGLSVVLVDSDLRRPTLHRVFELPNNVGLTTLLLRDDFSLEGHLQATKQGNLRLLTSGPLPPNPSELLSSKRMKGLLQHLREMAEVVILDSPPVLAVTDAAVLARQVDGVLLVLDSGRTRRDMAVRAADDLRKIGGQIFGVALNKMGAGGGYYYHYYYYSSDGERHRRKPQRLPLSLASWLFRR
ncbi:MAG: CpsD/CapB family tyrosine-protein kinase [Chloroflexi bacterium]|nr:CpsD/CapB family tyrosine-protein kinase [Chloroflexota bacterium]